MGFNVLVELPDGCRVLHARECEQAESLRSFVESQVCLDDFFLLHQGKLLPYSESVGHGEGDMTVVRCVPRLVGGKGGFGSMLRTIGNQIEKTTNKDACRDLNGRRIRDVKADKQMEEWRKGESERADQKDEMRKQRRERMLAEPKSTFDSHTYLTELKDQADKTEDAVRMGLEVRKSRAAEASTGGASATAAVSVSAVKRRSAGEGSTTSASKRRCATMRALDRFAGVDSDSDSSESDSDESKESELSKSTPDI